MAGCNTFHLADYTGPRKAYRRVRVTNPRGELIADWIAQGHVWRTERGFRFRAVERLSAPPNMISVRYPQGRMVEAAGPNITVARAGTPLWIYEMEHR
jgi:hypothetical protein